MNIRDPNFSLPDIQSQPDLRELRIEAVGIKGVRYPVTIRAGAGQQATVASFTMTVGLAAQVKGTHMSRFIELLEAQVHPLDQAGFMALLEAMLERLGAGSGAIEMRFPGLCARAPRYRRFPACSITTSAGARNALRTGASPCACR
jgi:GTP cyclohydrolase FolE2